MFILQAYLRTVKNRFKKLENNLDWYTSKSKEAKLDSVTIVLY